MVSIQEQKEAITKIINDITKFIYDDVTKGQINKRLIEKEYNISDFKEIVDPIILIDLIPMMQDVYYRNSPFIYSISTNIKKTKIKVQLNIK